MKKKTKNILKLICVIIILFSIILLVGFAWSKYRTSIDGEATAQIAKWSFKVDGNLQTSDVIDFAMTINQTNGSVAEGVIAPGTSGEIPITVDATGTGTFVEYTMNFTIINKPANLKLYLDQEKTMEIAVKQDTTDLSKVTFVKKGFMDLASTENRDNPVRTETIYWEWPYDYDVLVEAMKNADNRYSSNAQIAWEAYNKLDTDDEGKNVQIQISAIGEQVLNKPEMSITLKNGWIVPLTEENAANYYGAEVNYKGNAEDTNTYRLFYVDFANKYKDGAGTIYLKADWTTNNFDITNYENYESSNIEVFKNMNPKLCNVAQTNLDINNVKAITWLADPNVWRTNYASNENTYGTNVNYAIGCPSVELYIDSYNESHGKKVILLECNTVGYLYNDCDGTMETNETEWYSIDNYRNGMYAYNNRDYIWWWLASPSGDGEKRICYVNVSKMRVSSNWLDDETGVTPLISLKSTTQLELK